MKKIIIAIMLALAIAPMADVSAASSGPAAARLRGRILLQVEDSGQAWYVLPNTGTRAYMGRPTDAFIIMRALGLGVTNDNLAKIAEPSQKDTNLSFARKMSGKILLQVQSHGEAWYVNPVNLKRYYLGRPADALRVMGQLGLGIKTLDLEKITVDGKYGYYESPGTPVYSPKTVMINISNNAFDPPTMNINRGDTVVWTNADAAAHTITPVGTSLTDFGSGQLGINATYRYTFKQGGTFDYRCSVHPGMLGKIIVK